MKAFTALKSEFDNKGVTLVGASKDAKEPQAAFAEKFNVPFDLLCDESKELPGAVLPPGVSSSRWAALLNKGSVEKVWDKVAAATFPEEVLEEFKSGKL